MKVRNQRALLVVLGIIVVLILISIFKGSGGNEETIRIGAIESLTGDASYYGEQNRRGVEIAREEIERDYPEFDFEVYHEDSLYSPKTGVEVYNKLRNVNQIDAVITHASAVSLAIQPLAKNNEILQMATSASAAAYSSENDLSFRTSTSAETEARYVADYILDKGYVNVAILYMNNEIGKSMEEEVARTLEEEGLNLVFNEAFAFESSDFKTELIKIKQTDAEVIFAPGLASHTALILKQAKEINLNMPVVGFRGAEDPVLLEQAEIAEGFVYTYAFDSSSDNPTVRKFVDAYEDKYNEAPTGYSAEGYEGFKITALAFIECGKDNVCIQNYLENLQDYDSVFGKLSFDDSGDVYYEYFPKTVKDGKFVRLED